MTDRLRSKAVGCLLSSLLTLFLCCIAYTFLFLLWLVGMGGKADIVYGVLWLLLTVLLFLGFKYLNRTITLGHGGKTAGTQVLPPLRPNSLTYVSAFIVGLAFFGYMLKRNHESMIIAIPFALVLVGMQWVWYFLNMRTYRNNLAAGR